MKLSSFCVSVPGLAAVCLFAGTVIAREEPPMTAKLDELLRHPGDYIQVCYAVLSSFPAPIPVIRSIMHGEAGFSKAKLEFMKKNRARLVPAIASKLGSVDLLRKPKPQPPDPSAPKNEIE